MKKYQFRKGFTLIELLIVIAIISVLATIIVLSYAGAQVKSRDNKRKVDVQAIASAYQIHYQETKTWSFNTSELQKIPGLGATTANCEGLDGSGGAGWFNYDTGPYIVPMARALSGLGYLLNPPRDPLAGRDYMKYPACGGIVVYARLESSVSIGHPYSESDSLPPEASRTVGCQAQLESRSTNQSQLMNYGVNVK